MRHGHLLEGQLGDDVLEQREQPTAAKMTTDVAEPVVEAADDVQDQRAVSDGLAKGGEAVRHGLEATAVVGDGELPLDEVPELVVEVEGARLPLPQELGFQGEPDVASRGVALHHGLGEVGGDGARDPRVRIDGPRGG